MKNLLSLFVTLIFGSACTFLFSFVPILCETLPDLPQRSTGAAYVPKSSAGTFTSANPSIVSGAAIHRQLAGLAG